MDFILVNNFHDFLIDNFNLWDFIIDENNNKIYIETSEDEANFIISNLNQFFKGVKYNIDVRNENYFIIEFETNIKYYPNDY